MRPRPKLDATTADEDQKLAVVVDHFIHTEPSLRAQQARVVELQHRLWGLVDDEGWRAYLALDEATTARFADALVVVARWAFEAGATTGGQRPGGA